MYKQEPDHQRIFLAVFLAAIVLMGWQVLVEAPRKQKLAHYNAQQTVERSAENAARLQPQTAKQADSETSVPLTREQRLASSPRITIGNSKLHGSIALKGARFDDLTLAKYRVTMEAGSPEVRLLSPGGEDAPYLVQIGWLSGDGKTKVPTQDTLWQADKKSLSAGETVNLKWDNGEGVVFTLSLSLDADYMFTVRQRVENRSGKPVALMPYGFINRAYSEPKEHYGVMHEGPMGVMQETLEEISYKSLREKGNKVFDQSAGWLGISDKYWLTAIIPGEGNYKTTYSYYRKGSEDRYQADFLGNAATIEPGSSVESSSRLFAGAKEINVLDRYTEGSAAQKQPPIPLFDRAVDFGSLYILTKPMFLLLNFFFAHIGNFGLAIMMLTIVVRLLMYPLASKSYRSMGHLREVQPEILKIRERYADDSMGMNKALMDLYKREKINPAAGCLPVLIQMPVFFALYKVFYVTIEMRHASFFGWLKDLSAPDPTNIFTLFGLIPWPAPDFLHIGVLPMLMCATMVIQMRMQAKPADPVQAKMMGLMPYFFLVIFAKFAAGLVLYWVWSNTLSIAQQYIITKRHKKPAPKATKAA